MEGRDCVHEVLYLLIIKKDLSQNRFCFSTKTNLDSTLQCGRVLLNTESRVSQEAESLVRLNFYPSAEVSTIRKQLKYLKEQQEIGKTSSDPHFPAYLEDLELKVAENKLTLLRTSREEEELARAAYKKKIARLKFKEENQSRDPANFRNQKRF